MGPLASPAQRAGDDDILNQESLDKVGIENADDSVRRKRRDGHPTRFLSLVRSLSLQLPSMS